MMSYFKALYIYEEKQVLVVIAVFKMSLVCFLNLNLYFEAWKSSSGILGEVRNGKGFIRILVAT